MIAPTGELGAAPAAGDLGGTDGDAPIARMKF